MCIRDRFRAVRARARGRRPDRGSAARVRALPAVSYTHLRAHETPEHPVCRLLLEKKKRIEIEKDLSVAYWYFMVRVTGSFFFFFNDTATTEIYTRSLVGSVRCV